MFVEIPQCARVMKGGGILVNFTSHLQYGNISDAMAVLTGTDLPNTALDSI